VILDTVNRKLVAVLAGAKTSVDCPFVASWVDSTTSASTQGASVGTTNGVTQVDLVVAPAGSTGRFVRYLNVDNVDTGAIAITISYSDSTVLKTIISITLQIGERLEWNGTEWHVYDSTNALKTSFSTVATASVLGVVKPDGTIITVAAGAITVPQSTSSVFGVVKPDGTSITAAAGVISAVPTGRWIKTTIWTAGATFTTQAGTKTIFVRIVGGGGGGGGCSWASSNDAMGGGGAAGGYAEKTFTVTGSTGYSTTFGTAGTAGANTGGTGGTGGDSTIVVSGVTVTAKGGLGGVGMATGLTLLTVAGGAGVIPTNGDLNVPGDPGQYGTRLSGILGNSGAGGSGPLGSGGVGKSVATGGVGAAGTGLGGGGGGGCSISVAVLGGAGSAGGMIIDEYT
jgi:hypothetical protein